MHSKDYKSLCESRKEDTAKYVKQINVEELVTFTAPNTRADSTLM